ncbi:MAG: RNA polymerase sigma factor RpoH [Alphaproteobacteria bacterium ADurb.Bin438]|nr:MAG: RNA polymerase sigma factor RpoH [Alphaproteobacteria bacterium ADurb.Bin438]
MSNYLVSYNRNSIEKQDGLVSYLEQIKKIPMLSPDEEYALAVRLFDKKDVDAAQKLVSAYLKLSAKVAISFKNYGLPLADLISEANIGLMHAVKKFNPYKGQKLATYAMWWIKAYLYDFVLKSWSLVKIGTIAAQKKLFYALRREKARLDIYDNSKFDDEAVKKISKDLNVSEKEVIEMSQRIDGDTSLNTKVGDDFENEKQDMLVDKTPSIETLLVNKSDMNEKKALFMKALKTLNEREIAILKARRLKEIPDTLEDLSLKYEISRERVRQIEMRAFEKICKFVQNG